MTRSILVNSVAGVDATTLEEQCTQRCTRALRSDHDHIDILGRNDTCAVVPVDSETVAVVQCLALGEERLDLRPLCDLTCVRKQHSDDGTLLSSLLDGEQRLTGNPTISNSLVIAAALTLAYDYIETVIAKIAGLTRTLDTVANDCNRLILQYFTCFL